MNGHKKTRLVEVRTKILKENDVAARALRQRFEDEGVVVVSLVSSPGAGKTMFLERTLLRLREQYQVAALVGDLVLLPALLATRAGKTFTRRSAGSQRVEQT